MDIITEVVRLLSSHNIYFVKLAQIIYKHKFIMDSIDCPMFLAPSVFSDVYLHKIMFSCLFITFIVSMARRINYNSISIGIRRLDKQERSSALLLHNKGTLIIGK